MEESPEAMGLARRPLLQHTQSQTTPGDDLESQQCYSRSEIFAVLGRSGLHDHVINKAKK